VCKDNREHLFVPCLLVILLIFGCNEGTDPNTVTASVGDESEPNQVPEEVSKIVQCLYEFVCDNKQNEHFKYYEIELNEDDIIVSYLRKEREDLLFIGGWQINKYNYPTHPPRIIEVNDLENPGFADLFGRGVMIDARDVLLFDGEWTGGPHWYIVASKYFSIVGGHTTGVFIRIEKSDENLYEVTDWDVINFLISDID
jgi:hypothetical protein